MGIFTKQIDETRRRLIDIVTDVSLQVEFTAKNETAPQGATGQLRQNIVGSDAFEDFAGNIVGVISSAAFNNGEDYAEKQHDEPLFHAVPKGEPMKLSFADFGESGTPFERYQQGYQRTIKILSPDHKYPTKYIDRAIEINRPLLESELEREGFDVGKLTVETA